MNSNKKYNNLKTHKIFFFDGDCPFCQKLAEKLKTLCLSDQIQFLSFRQLSEGEISQYHPHLSRQNLQAEVQMIHNNRRYPGFFAIRKLSHYLRGYRYFAWLLYLPLVPFLGMLFLSILKKFHSSH